MQQSVQIHLETVGMIRKKAASASKNAATAMIQFQVCSILVDNKVEEWFKVFNLTSVTLEEENKKHGIGNEHTTLANQPHTTVHPPNDDHQTSSENISAFSSSITLPQVCTSSELST